MRQETSKVDKLCIMKFNEDEGTITGMTQHENYLLSSSNDGTLSVYDIRHNKACLYAMSDSQDEDLSSIVVMKYGRNVVTASQEGVISIFKWGMFGDCNDRLTGHPKAIDKMIKYDEDTIITAGEDGMIRACSVHPNKILSYIGDDDLEDMEDDYDPLSINCLSLSHDKQFIASASNDDIIKIHRITNLAGRVKEDYDSDEEETITHQTKPNQEADFEEEEIIGGTGEEEEEIKGEVNDADMDWDEVQAESSSESSEEEEQMTHKQKMRVNKKDNYMNIKNNTLGKAKAVRKMRKKEEFFKGL